MNELEQAVLRLFFESEGFGNIEVNLTLVRILKRDSTGSGFMTWLVPHDLEVLNGPLNFTGGRVGGKINDTIDVGFVVHIKNSYVDIVEGYTYDEEWPQEIRSFKLSLINFTGGRK
jgi:hypothetical protein